MTAPLTDDQTAFVDFLLQCGVLRFGDFVTKSGRSTPYFINTGLYRTGAQMAALGRFYAAAIARTGLEFDVLFGPAYKGIPLVVATAAALAERDRDVAFCFNRKEAKDHGEGGVIVGHELQDGDRVLIVEDVTTSGRSIRESVPVLKAAADVQVVGLVVSVDRQERGTTDRGALAELRDEFDLHTSAIVTLDQILAHLGPTLEQPLLDRIADYKEAYGVR